jgi:hypothetical protein
MSCGANLLRTPAAAASPAAAAPPVRAEASTAPAPRVSGFNDLCSLVVERLGSWWPLLGWMAFVGWYGGGLFLSATPAGAAVYWTCLALTFIWWNVDLTDQQVAGWQIAVGLVMIAIGHLPRGGFLILACWVLYWTRVRE